MASLAQASVYADRMRGAVIEGGRPDLVTQIGVMRVGSGFRPATRRSIPVTDKRVMHRAFLVARGNRAGGFCFDCWTTARSLPPEDRRPWLRNCDHPGRFL